MWTEKCVRNSFLGRGRGKAALKVCREILSF
jgi:hypothetical protein